MATDLQRVATKLQSAGDYLDVFGECEGDKSSQEKHVKSVYRQIARTVHPDRYSLNGETSLASEAFVLLQEYERQASAAIKDGKYGKVTGATIRTKRFVHVASKVAARGDLADLLLTRSTPKRGGPEERTILKVVRSAKDNDLLTAEAKALKKLRAAGSDEKLHPYAPRLLETLKVSDGSRKRQANVIEYLPGFYNLEQVLEAYPGGLNPLDMAWIWRRLLVAIGFAHEQELIHGAVLPSHVMILPEKHGLVLVDWSYSVSSESDAPPAIKALSSKYRDWYPKEVLKKQSPSNGTDVSMAARTMVQLLGGDPIAMSLPNSVPKQFRAFFRGCVASNQYARPQNAWALLGEFDELLESIGAPYYPRRFRPFTMSPKAGT